MMQESLPALQTQDLRNKNMIFCRTNKGETLVIDSHSDPFLIEQNSSEYILSEEEKIYLKGRRYHVGLWQDVVVVETKYQNSRRNSQQSYWLASL